MEKSSRWSGTFHFIESEILYISWTKKERIGHNAIENKLLPLAPDTYLLPQK